MIGTALFILLLTTGFEIRIPATPFKNHEKTLQGQALEDFRQEMRPDDFRATSIFLLQDILPIKNKC